MWKLFGTFVNTVAVIIGGLIGTLLSRRKSAIENAEQSRIAGAMMPCLGFCTVFAAVSGLTGIENGIQAIIAVSSAALGVLTGTLLRLDDRINLLGKYITKRIKRENGTNPAEGFVTACLLFCIGSMTILGSFESAANPAGHLELSCHTTLIIKSLLDFVSSVCLSVTCGASVMLSALFVLIFQGMLTLLASVLQPFLISIGALPMVYCCGSIVLLAIAVNLIGLKKIKTADYIPAIFFPILFCALSKAIGIML